MTYEDWNVETDGVRPTSDICEADYTVVSPDTGVSLHQRDYWGMIIIALIVLIFSIKKLKKM